MGCIMIIVVRWKRRDRRRVRITSGPLCVPKKKTRIAWGIVDGMIMGGSVVVVIGEGAF